MTLIKRSTFASALVGVLLAATGPVMARDLTVVSWGGNFQDAQRQIFFQPFSQAAGRPVLDESWDGGFGVLQSRVMSGAPVWDVVQVEAEELALGCEDGLFEPIDWTRIEGGKEAFLPAAVSECGVGAIVWSTAIAYDRDRLQTGPQSWADFWDTNRFPGKRGLRRGPKYTLEFALMADGVAPGDVYKTLATEAGVDRAFAKLDALRGNIVWWEAGAQPLQLLASGEVAMTSAYNGRITGINRSEGRNFQVVFPQSIYAVDSWVVLAKAENADAGQDFIAFASDPARMAELPRFIAYGQPRYDAAALVPQEYRADLPTDPANLGGALALDVDFWIDNSEALTQRFNAWLAQ